MVTMAESAANRRATRTFTWIARIHSHTYINTVTTTYWLCAKPRQLSYYIIWNRFFIFEGTRGTNVWWCLFGSYVTLTTQTNSIRSIWMFRECAVSCFMPFHFLVHSESPTKPMDERVNERTSQPTNQPTNTLASQNPCTYDGTHMDLDKYTFATK